MNMETKKETEEDPLFPKPKKKPLLPPQKRPRREDEQDNSSGKNGCHDKAGTMPETYKE